MKISLVILTRNEIVGLRALWEKIPLSAVDEVLAVDGGSTDGTVEFLKHQGVRVFSQTVRGRGEAFRMAFSSTDSEALIFFSPDGNENPSDIPRFRPLLEAGSAMVIANRMTGGGKNEEDEKLLPLRKWANLAFTWMANVAWNRGNYIHDTINGFRAVRRDAWEIMKPDGEGYVIEYQSSIRAFKQGLPLVEFPTIEGQRIDAREGSPSIPTGIAFLKLYFKELFSHSAQSVRLQDDLRNSPLLTNPHHKSQTHDAL